MGLLDSALGSVLAGQNPQGGGLGGLGNVLGSMLGGGQAPAQPGDAPAGAAGGINMGLVAALAPVLMGMLANNSQHGGLGGLRRASRALARATQRSPGWARAAISRSARPR